jgi:hypothetical protein
MNSLNPVHGYTEDFVGFTLDLSKKKFVEKRRNKTAIELPQDGNYYLKSRRIHESSQRCDVCGRNDHAKNIVEIIQNKGEENERTFFAGLDCLEEHYDFDRAKIDAIAKDSGRVRATVNKKFGRNFRSSEEVFSELSVMAQENVPSNHITQIMEYLNEAKSVLTQDSKRTEEILGQVHFCIMYHREYRLNLDLFNARFEALGYHLKFSTSNRGTVRALCREAINLGSNLGLNLIFQLQKYFDTHWKKRSKSNYYQEEFESTIHYAEAVQSWFSTYVSGDPEEFYWDQKAKMKPQSSLGAGYSSMYMRYAIKSRDLKRFIEELPNQKWIVVTEPDQPRYTYEDFYIDRSRDDEGIIKNEKRINATYEYILVAVHALEPRTQIHELWHKWGQGTLDNWPELSV